MTRLLLPVLVLLAALAQPSQARLDFADFAGIYPGTYELDTPPSRFATGSLTALVTVNPSGRRLTIELYGLVTRLSGSPGPYATYTQLVLKSNRQVSTNDTVIGYFEDLAPSTSRFSGRTDKFTFTLVKTPPGYVMTYVLKFTKKRIVIRGTGASGTTPVTVFFKGKRK